MRDLVNTMVISPLKLNTSNMKKRIRYTVFVLMGSLLLSGNVCALRVSFGLYAKDNIQIFPEDLGQLNFNTKQEYIFANQSVTVNLLDLAASAISITGRRDQEITVTVSSPGALNLNASQIPLSIRFAYSNTGATNATDAKLSAVELPVGFTSATFPLLRRASGLPAPPPTPMHAGQVMPQGTVYIFIYGTLGPVPSNAEVGNYLGDINIQVEYTTYE